MDYSGKDSSETYKEIQIRRYASDQLTYKLSALAYTFPFYRQRMSRPIRHFLKDNNIEVIHVHDMVIAETVMRINKNFKLPVVLDLHENRPEIMKAYPHLNKFPGKYLISTSFWKKEEERLVQQVDKVIVVTREAREELIHRARIDKRKVEVIPNTVATSFSKEYSLDSDILSRYKDKFVVLYLGDTGLRRGLLSMISAFSKIASTPELSERLSW